MSDYAHPGGGAARPTGGGPGRGPTFMRTGVPVGWGGFAGVIMILIGVFGIISGLTALINSRYYNVGPTGLLAFDLVAWGWIHLIIGILMVLGGLALFSGAAWARIAAVVLAAINAFIQLSFLPLYPTWSTIVIALDVLIIGAIVVQGREELTRRMP